LKDIKIADFKYLHGTRHLYHTVEESTMKKRIGIKEVANEAGVSIATVSYVVNNKQGIKLASDTEEKVKHAIKKLGYVPNLSARILANNKSNMIGVVIPQTENEKAFMLHNPFYSEFLSSFEYKARTAEYHVLISGTNADERYIDIAQKRNLDGIVILGAYPKDVLNDLKESKIPIVLVDTYMSDGYFNAIGTNDKQGAYEATKFLISKGHKNITVVTGSVEEHGVNQERLDGYKKALTDSGIAINENYIFTGTVSYEYGEKVAERMKELSSEITAVFCTADILALGLLKGLHKLHISVPKDISVMGFDDIYLADLITPSLTTVKQNITSKGECAAKMIIDLAEDKIKEKQMLFVPMEIIERESVREV
jgi:LacI family transcriptional regulator